MGMKSTALPIIVIVLGIIGCLCFGWNLWDCYCSYEYAFHGWNYCGY